MPRRRKERTLPTNCNCSNFPASLGNITFEGNVGIGLTTLVTGARLQVAGGFFVLPNGDFAQSAGIRFLNTSGALDAGIYEANNNQLHVRAGTGGRINLVSSAGTIIASISGTDYTFHLRAGASVRPQDQNAVTALQVKTYEGAAYVTFGSTNQRVGLGTNTPGS